MSNEIELMRKKNRYMILCEKGGNPEDLKKTQGVRRRLARDIRNLEKVISAVE